MCFWGQKHLTAVYCVVRAGGGGGVGWTATGSFWVRMARCAFGRERQDGLSCMRSYSACKLLWVVAVLAESYAPCQVILAVKACLDCGAVFR
jgi:hypothetical protein